MGGGIAYQAAYKGLPIVMKDIRDDALALGMNEAGKLLSKQVERGRMTPAKMSETAGRIRPNRSELRRFRQRRHHHRSGRRESKVKKVVLAEVEGLVREDTSSRPTRRRSRSACWQKASSGRRISLACTSSTR